MYLLKTFSLAILMLGIALSSVSGQNYPDNSPAFINGKLTLKGNQLTNEFGNAVQLRGMSSHGIQWTFGDCWTSASFKVLAEEWGVDILRGALYPQAEGFKYSQNPAGWKATTDSHIKEAGKLGLYYMVDWHVLEANGVSSGDPNRYKNDAIDYFSYLAKTHAGKDHVLYEIANEPSGVSWGSVKSYAEDVIAAIRKYDKDAIIIVGTPQWSADLNQVVNNQLSGSSAHNVMYAFHFYAGSHFNYDDVTNWGKKNAHFRH